jgi:apolipoprotein N-acyltransferase
LIRCGNGGWSGCIDEFGLVRATVTNASGSIYFRGVKAFDVTRDDRWVGQKSVYAEHGDWFVAVCAVLIAFAAAMLRMARGDKRESAA